MSWPTSHAQACRVLVRVVAFTILVVSSMATAEQLPAKDGTTTAVLTSEVRRLSEEGQYRLALGKAFELLGLAKSSSGEISVPYAEAASWVGVIHQMLGRIDDAEPYIVQALEIYRKLLPPGHPDIASATNNLGFQNQSAGRYEEAERLYKQALEMRERATSPDPLAVAESLNNIGQIYKRQGRIVEAEEPLRRSYELRESVLGADHPLVAQSMQNYAALLELNSRFEDAERMLRKVLDIRRRLQRGSHPETAGTVSKLAQNLYKQRRFAEAESLFREAIAMQRAALASMPREADKQQRLLLSNAGQVSTDGRVSMNTLLDLALNQIELGKLQEAGELLRQVHAAYRAALTPTHPAMAQTKAAIAEVASRQGRHTDALNWIRGASEIRIARGSDDDLSRVTYLKHVRFAWREHVAAGADNPKLLEEALLAAQRAARIEAMGALSRLAQRAAAASKDLKSLLRERDDLESLQTTLEDKLDRVLLIAPEQRGDVMTDMRQTLSVVANRLTEIRDRDLRTRHPQYLELIQPEPLTVQQIAGLLGADEALVNFLCSYDETYVWAVSREGASWQRIDLGPDQLSSMVGSLRAGLDYEHLRGQPPPGAPLFDLGLAHELYRRLLQPVSKTLAGKRHLNFVLCGALTSLPPSLLVTEPPPVPRPTTAQVSAYREARWLAHKHSVSILPSVPSLKTLRSVVPPGGGRRPLLGFANPVLDAGQMPGAGGAPSRRRDAAVVLAKAAGQQGYSTFWRGRQVDSEALRSLPTLPETEAELRLVAASIGGAPDLRLGAAASETAVKQARLDDYQVVYFATHGLVAGAVAGQGEPALALTVPDQPSDIDDGLLTASEIGQLKFASSWVVLAVCNTAAGSKPGAEALAGLARAFIEAGARALLVSHWRGNMEISAKLAGRAIELARKDPGMGHAEALRRAMLAYATDAKDPWHAYPAFWAPFVLVGEGAAGSRQPLPTSPPSR